MAVQSIPRLQSLPLAWGYTCRRIESRMRAICYQRADANAKYREAVTLFGRARKAGGAERAAAQLAAKIIRENVRITDPGEVAMLMAEAGGL